jgi:hypothetical protein
VRDGIHTVVSHHHGTKAFLLDEFRLQRQLQGVVLIWASTAGGALGAYRPCQIVRLPA